nr:pseudouridine synthase [uncultured Niameybacter sp.]
MVEKKMRLDKYLVHTGYGSRSQVQQLIKKKKVKVNGEVEKRPEYGINPLEDVVSLGEEVVDYKTFYYYILNKPAGYITATEDPKQETVMDLLDPITRGRTLAPVGRLDKDTEGLLILTNDGKFNHALLSPKKHVDKCYYAKVTGQVTKEDCIAFSEGIDIGEAKPCMPASLEIIEANEENSKVYITIKEGKFHQVKRMMKAVGKEVTYLKRISMGNLKLPEDLALGEYRQLTQEELDCLKGQEEK